MNHALAITGLARSYDGTPVFSNVDLQLARGEFVALLGESGVGKSTLLNCIAGLDDPDAGQVLLAGALVRSLPEPDRARLRRVADDPLRIAEMIQGRTSQPFEVIVAMLTRTTEALTSPTEESSGFASGRTDAARVALRIVRSDSGTRRELRDLLRA